MKVILDIKKNTEKGIFYRYKVGKYQMWFEQHHDGNIYSVGIVPKENTSYNPKFQLYINGCTRNFYPNAFKMSTISWGSITIEEALKHSNDIRYGVKVLKCIEQFFEKMKTEEQND